MNSTLSTFIVLLTLCFIFSSCDNDCVKPAGIHGEWIWQESVAEGSHPTTPETAGYSIRLIIDDYIYKSYTDDSLMFESQYDLVITEDSSNQNTFLVFPSGFELGIDVSESDLILWNYNFTHYIKTTYCRK